MTTNLLLTIIFTSSVFVFFLLSSVFSKKPEIIVEEDIQTQNPKRRSRTSTNATKSKVNKPKVNKQPVSKPKVSKPKVNKPKVSKPAVAKKSKVNKQPVSKPKVSKSKVNKPAVTKKSKVDKQPVNKSNDRAVVVQSKKPIDLSKVKLHEDLIIDKNDINIKNDDINIINDVYKNAIQSKSEGWLTIKNKNGDTINSMKIDKNSYNKILPLLSKYKNKNVGRGNTLIYIVWNKQVDKFEVKEMVALKVLNYCVNTKMRK